MIWGCILWEGVKDACKIDGRMDGDLYIKILEDDLQSSFAFYDKTVRGTIQNHLDPLYVHSDPFRSTLYLFSPLHPEQFGSTLFLFYLHCFPS